MQHIEHQEQCKVFAWAKYNEKRYPFLAFLHASTAGEKFKNAIQAHRAKLAGMRKGVPDMFLPLPRAGYHGLFIEMKRPIRKGYAKPQVSPEQNQWLSYLNANGYMAVVCYGAEQAIQAIQEYIEHKV